MGIAEVRDAFNTVSQPFGFTCSKATMGYERANGSEWQRLTFYGTGAGAEFTIVADRARASDDLAHIARLTAQRLVDERAPK